MPKPTRMKLKYLRKLVFMTPFLLLPALAGFAQTGGAKPAEQAVRATPAYAELLLRRTELESILEDLSDAYTEENPKIKEARRQLELIEKDRARLLTFGTNDVTKMTLALGKLLVRRAELETALWSLKTRFSDAHPDVVRAKRRVASFDRAIGEILP
jgi:hypothetical protein